MKNNYKILPYCTKHQLRHGQKYPSCQKQVKRDIGGSFSLNVPSGARVDFQIKGALRAKDISFLYKMLKLQHVSFDEE